MGYELMHSQVPRRRELDYLRTLGASKESAKEMKLFGLADFVSSKFEALSNGIYDENVAFARRRFIWGAMLNIVSSTGYYAGYAWAVWQAVEGKISIGTLTFLAGAIAQANSSLQAVFSTSASIADQALFLGDLITFFNEKPQIQAKPNAALAPRPVRDGFRFENVSFHYPGSERQVVDGLNLELAPGERLALVGENGQGKTDYRQADLAPLRPNRRPHSARWRGSARLQPGRPRQPDRRDLSGFHALRHERARQHRDGPNRPARQRQKN